MPRLPGQQLRLGLGHDGLALVRSTGLFGARVEVLAEVRLDDAGAPEDLARGLRALTEAVADARLAGWPLSVVLADELARIWQVAPPPGAASLADLEAAATMRFTALFGGLPAGWAIAADWQASEPFLAAAVPAALLEVLQAWTRDNRCHLVEVVPQLVAAMNGWRKQRRPGAWFGVVQGAVLSMAAYDDTRLAALRTAVVPPGAGRDWLESLVAREALRIGAAQPAQLQLCGTAPRAWTTGTTGLACTLLERHAAALEKASAAVRLACTGSAA